MTIRVNGEERQVRSPLTIGELLDELGIDPRRVAVEQNITVIKRDRYASTPINEGDEIEIVNFVGGG